MTQWKYFTVWVPSETIETHCKLLDDYGRAGWELVTVLPVEDAYRYFLKKEVMQNPER